MMPPYQREAKSGPRGKKLDHLRISKAENGGHIIEHHFKEDGFRYHKPEAHVFADDEGQAAHDHIAKHMDMPIKEESE